MPPSSEEALPIMAPHRKLTVEQYHRMGDVGILHTDDRVELIEGELIEMPPSGNFHAGLANLLNEWLTPWTVGRATTCIQNPIRLGPYSEPKPDFMLLRFRSDRYKHFIPTAGDVFLLIEIADATVRYDREVKGGLYARHEIEEYWLINIPDQHVEVHSQPDAAGGCYRDVRTALGGFVSPRRFPDVALDIRQILS
jgi:Uma2 family endonuclease